MITPRVRSIVLRTLLGVTVLGLLGELAWWADHRKIIEAQVRVTETNIVITDLEYESWPEVTIYVNGTSSSPKHKIRWAVPMRRGQSITLRRSDLPEGKPRHSEPVEPVEVVRLAVPHHAVTRFDFVTQSGDGDEQVSVSMSTH